MLILGTYIWLTTFAFICKFKKIERQADRQTDRQTDKDKRTFQLSYQNKSCSECQQDVIKIERQADRQTDRSTDRQIERQKDFSA